MNRNDFIRMVEGNTPVDPQMTSEINEIIELFPYFQSAHLLLLKGLRNTSDIKFEKQLRNSSIYAADREVLYYLLQEVNDSAENKPETEEEPVKPEAEEEPVKPETEEEPVQSEKVSEEETVLFNREENSQQTVIESAKNSEELIYEIEKELQESNQTEQDSKENLAFTHSILISADADEDELEKNIFVVEDESEPIEERVIYMDPGFSVPEEYNLLELDSEDIKPDMQTPEEEIKSRKQLHSGLIDKFILANPRIEPSREKSDLPVEDISKPFVEETGGFVTETLARIYVNQGYYSKAIEIYENLILKFPEKSSYFATLIEKVKELIK